MALYIISEIVILALIFFGVIFFLRKSRKARKKIKDSRKELFEMQIKLQSKLLNKDTLEEE